MQTNMTEEHGEVPEMLPGIRQAIIAESPEAYAAIDAAVRGRRNGRARASGTAREPDGVRAAACCVVGMTRRAFLRQRPAAAGGRVQTAASSTRAERGKPHIWNYLLGWTPFVRSAGEIRADGAASRISAPAEQPRVQRFAVRGSLRAARERCCSLLCFTPTGQADPRIAELLLRAVGRRLAETAEHPESGQTALRVLLRGYGSGAAAAAASAAELTALLRREYPDGARRVRIEAFLRDPKSDAPLPAAEQDAPAEWPENARVTVVYSLKSASAGRNTDVRALAVYGTARVLLLPPCAPEAARRAPYLCAETGETCRAGELDGLPEGVYIADENGVVIRIQDMGALNGVLDRLGAAASVPGSRRAALTASAEDWFTRRPSTLLREGNRALRERALDRQTEPLKVYFKAVKDKQLKALVLDVFQQRKALTDLLEKNGASALPDEKAATQYLTASVFCRYLKSRGISEISDEVLGQLRAELSGKRLRELVERAVPHTPEDFARMLMTDPESGIMEEWLDGREVPAAGQDGSDDCAGQDGSDD